MQKYYIELSGALILYNIYKKRQERRRKQLLDDLERNRRYCELKYEAPVRSLWRIGIWEVKDLLKTHFEINECMNK